MNLVERQNHTEIVTLLRSILSSLVDIDRKISKLPKQKKPVKQ